MSAYAAAIFGRLKSLPLTFLGAIVVGCMESYLAGYLPQNDYLPGLRLAAPAILLLLALLLFPHGRLRGRDRQLSPVPLPTMRGTWFLAAVIVLFGVILATVLSDSDILSYGRIFAVGVDRCRTMPLARVPGQISLYQISPRSGAIVLRPPRRRRSMVRSSWRDRGRGGRSGDKYLALRLSGVYLALGTAAIAVIFDRWIFTCRRSRSPDCRISLFDQGSIEVPGPSLFRVRRRHAGAGDRFRCGGTGADDGRSGVAAARTPGPAIDRASRQRGGLLRLGGNLLAGKLLVFGLSSAIAGVGGGLYGMSLQSATPDQFNHLRDCRSSWSSSWPGSARWVQACSSAPACPARCIDRCAVAGDQGDVAGTARDRCCGLRRQGRPGGWYRRAAQTLEQRVRRRRRHGWAGGVDPDRLGAAPDRCGQRLCWCCCSYSPPCWCRWWPTGACAGRIPLLCSKNRPMFKRANLIRICRSNGGESPGTGHRRRRGGARSCHRCSKLRTSMSPSARTRRSATSPCMPTPATSPG